MTSLGSVEQHSLGHASSDEVGVFSNFFSVADTFVCVHDIAFIFVACVVGIAKRTVNAVLKTNIIFLLVLVRVKQDWYSQSIIIGK